jgi:hypothetical protein
MPASAGAQMGDDGPLQSRSLRKLAQWGGARVEDEAQDGLVTFSYIRQELKTASAATCHSAAA